MHKEVNPEIPKSESRPRVAPVFWRSTKGQLPHTPNPLTPHLSLSRSLAFLLSWIWVSGPRGWVEARVPRWRGLEPR